MKHSTRSKGSKDYFSNNDHFFSFSALCNCRNHGEEARRVGVTWHN